MNMKLTRRQFLKTTAIAGVGMALPLKFWKGSAHAFYQSPGLQKWQTTLRGVGATDPRGGPGRICSSRDRSDPLHHQHQAVYRPASSGPRPDQALGISAQCPRVSRCSKAPRRHYRGAEGYPAPDHLPEQTSCQRQSSPWIRRSLARTRPRTAWRSTSTAALSPGSATAGLLTGGPRTARTD